MMMKTLSLAVVAAVLHQGNCLSCYTCTDTQWSSSDATISGMLAAASDRDAKCTNTGDAFTQEPTDSVACPTGSCLFLQGEVSMGYLGADVTSMMTIRSCYTNMETQCVDGIDGFFDASQFSSMTSVSSSGTTCFCNDDFCNTGTQAEENDDDGNVDDDDNSAKKLGIGSFTLLFSTLVAYWMQ